MDLRKRIFSDIKISKKHLLAIILILLAPILYLHNFPKDKRFQPSGLNSKFDFDISQPFSKYIEHSREIILKARVDLDSKPVSGEKILEWNSPFILYPQAKCKNKKRGILLIHGLTDSPFTMRELGENLREKCFIVYGLLLTGNGTRPADLLNVDYHEWIRQVEYGVSELSKETKEIYLGGYSNGGLLSINYALDHDNVRGLILFAPSLVLPSIVNIAPIFKYIYKWFWVYDDEDVVKYESFTSNGAEQVRLMAELVNSKLKKDNSRIKNLKVFAVFANEDVTINAPESVKTLINNTNPKNRHIIIYHQNNSDIDPKTIREKNIFPINASNKNKNFIGMSHLSLAIKPDNYWAGSKAAYRNCLHYEKGSDKYKKCKTSKDVYFGEITKENLKEYDGIARSTYNPFIEDVYLQLEKFI